MADTPDTGPAYPVWSDPGDADDVVRIVVRPAFSIPGWAWSWSCRGTGRAVVVSSEDRVEAIGAACRDADKEYPATRIVIDVEAGE
jgi:hypothetical protein